LEYFLKIVEFELSLADFFYFFKHPQIIVHVTFCEADILKAFLSNIKLKFSDVHAIICIYVLGILQKHKWENAMTIDRKCWGYRKEAVLTDFLTFEELIKELMSTISCGGIHCFVTFTVDVYKIDYLPFYR
jgi:hypothetical protein